MPNPSSALSYLLLITSVIFLINYSFYTPWAVIAFTVASMYTIDQWLTAKRKKGYSPKEKKLDIGFRLFLSFNILIIVINRFVLDGSTQTTLIAYLMLLIPLTILLVYKDFNVSSAA
ncbi:hypothetical protein C772_01426 [Bhargavaea cecembensis DSE10]|uniref:Uncharacterized protein n=1 Tax=Bhargavaea cecembensis DSE10 TaxID=1235279 RepID=M7NH61_9BACL|nr:hypothetical protein C772_01426 [Bhargavaea cecembensis DSE10]